MDKNWVSLGWDADFLSQEYPSKQVQWLSDPVRWTNYEDEVGENRTLASKLLDQAKGGLPFDLNEAPRPGMVMTRYAQSLVLRLWQVWLEREDPRAPISPDALELLEMGNDVAEQEWRKIPPMVLHVLKYMEANNLPFMRKIEEQDVFPPEYETFLWEIQQDGNEDYLTNWTPVVGENLRENH